MDGRSPLEIELPGPLNLVKKPLLKAIKGTSVSYTHLDVYKRQVIIIVVIQAEPAKAFFKKLTKKSGKEAARA